MISRLVMSAQIMGLCVWLLYLGLAVLLVFVFMWPHYLLRPLGSLFEILRTR